MSYTYTNEDIINYLNSYAFENVIFLKTENGNLYFSAFDTDHEEKCIVEILQEAEDKILVSIKHESSQHFNIFAVLTE
ncbi:hypothetical protein [Halalkalibacter oceani]|uniref:hypothetical protein n=1 Tax=Halalkalibacter oceani TaxID=1653776 RepID=UPI0033908FAD